VTYEASANRDGSQTFNDVNHSAFFRHVADGSDDLPLHSNPQLPQRQHLRSSLTLLVQNGKRGGLQREV